LEKVIPQIAEWKKSPTEIPLLLPYQYFLEENYSQALTLALSQSKNNPQVPSLALLVGESAFRMDHYPLAMEYFQKAKKLAPAALEPRLGILECHWHLEEYEEFQGEFLSIADQLEEKDRAYYAALSHCKVGGDPLQGVRLLGSAIELRGIDGILLVEYGRQLILAGKKTLALKWIKQGLKSAPGNKGLINLVAEHFPPEQEGKKSSPLPLSDWKAYLKEHPEDNRARFQMAQSLLKGGKFVEAQKHLQKLLTKGYSTENLLRALAWTYRKLGDYNEAYLVYQQLLQQSPSKLIFIPPMLLCLIKLGNPQRAELISKRLAAKKGVPSPILMEIADLFTKAQLLEQAMNLWRKASQLVPTDPTPLEGMARTYTAQGKKVLAKEFTAHAAKLRKSK
jgi:tetratricopeptide (TPR) repeat protein